MPRSCDATGASNVARYRKIDPRIWNDAKFRSLSDNAKLVFLMLLTHPSMTALGAMRATQAGLAAEMGWSPETFQDAFGQALREGMAEVDESACLVALPRFLRYNSPESPNVVKAWVGAVDMLPECNLKTLILQRARTYAEGMTEGFGKAFHEAFDRALSKQEQEQEHEKEPKINSVAAAGASLPSDPIWGTGLKNGCRTSGELPRDNRSDDDLIAANEEAARRLRGGQVREH